MLNNAFLEAGMNDMMSLVPLMFMVILLITAITIRSVSGTFATLLVIMLSTMVAMGFAGFAGIGLTPISGVAPIVILTLAVADSIHILISLRTLMREGLDKAAAIVDAARVNFMPVTITSLTTIVGFLALNFSDSPPFWHLGNMAAVGIGAAWVYSVTLLPALVSVLPVKVKQGRGSATGEAAIAKLAEFTIRHRRRLLPAALAVCAGLIALIPTIQYNDDFAKYFSQRVEFRTETDHASENFGIYPIEFSVPALGAGGVSDPEYLAVLDQFAEYLRAQPNVAHVFSFSDIMKRLNKNLHGDDVQYYRLPEDRELSAQYLLLYEMSLPYGLDLNDRIDIKKSASRVTATLVSGTTSETKVFLKTATNWLVKNAPDYMRARPTSAQVMFTYITDRNVQNMMIGTTIAVAAIAVIMMLALRSVSLGLLSLIPNALPILATFGAWAVLVGEVGFSVATVASISLGVIVDDTVHFLSKYVRARREGLLDPFDSVRYAFKSVGVAIIVNTVILTTGFPRALDLQLQGERGHGANDGTCHRVRTVSRFYLAAGATTHWSA